LQQELRGVKKDHKEEDSAAAGGDSEWDKAQKKAKETLR
jgi:hypothetical protein